MYQCQTVSEQCCSESDTLFLLARKAKYELLKDKLKAAWDQKDGERFEKAAEIVVDAILAHKRNEMDSAQKWEEVEKKLSDAWSD